MNRDKTFRLHQFPQIPLPIVKDTGSRDNNGQRFQRLFGAATAHGETLDKSCLVYAAEGGVGPDLELGRLEAAAYAEGFRKGERDGIAAAGGQVQQAVESLAEAVAGLAQLQQTLAGSSEARLVELALAIGRKVVGYETAINPEVVVHVARQALKSVENLQEVTLRLNPQDLQFLEENQKLSAQLAPHIGQIHLEADESIESGGCVIDSACGVIDARIESQLELIEKAFQTQLDKSDESES